MEMELGVTEQLVADRFSSTVQKGVAAAEKMLELFHDLESVDWEEVVTDADKKKNIGIFLDSLEKLTENLTAGSLVPQLISLVCSPAND